MRFGRLFLGLALILFALWIIIGEQITGVSSDAVVNARLTTIRAPIAGSLKMPRRILGSEVSSGEQIATLNDALVDNVHLNDLRMERAFAAAEVDRLIAFSAAPETTQTGTDPEVLANRSPRTSIRLGHPELSIYLTEARQRLAAIETRLAQETTRVALLAHASLIAPSNGVLWEVLADDGEVVQRGQDVMKLMMCKTALVTLSVPANIYNQLQVGHKVSFRLDGTEALYDGTIARIAGAGAETIYRNLAVAPSLKHLERYDVALLVPKLRENTDLSCAVGQTGRVFFDTRPLDWLRSLVN
jgi:multidrug resistance efflux pump